MLKTRWLLLLFGAVLIGGVWFYFNYQKKAQGQANAQGQAASTEISSKQGGRGGPGGPVPVVAGTAQKRDVPIYLDGIGTVQAYNTVTFHPQVSGILTQIAFQEGQ